MMVKSLISFRARVCFIPCVEAKVSIFFHLPSLILRHTPAPFSVYTIPFRLASSSADLGVLTPFHPVSLALFVILPCHKCSLPLLFNPPQSYPMEFCLNGFPRRPSPLDPLQSQAGAAHSRRDCLSAVVYGDLGIVSNHIDAWFLLPLSGGFLFKKPSRSSQELD
jgi:hypothetical protein